jgi:RNA polymerase sigma-70 factor (ECF subfamily)
MIGSRRPVLICDVTDDRAEITADRSDSTLLRAWQGGDGMAGTWLFARHLAGVRKFFRRAVRPQDADDLVQRTFVALLEASRRFRGDGPLAALVGAIARRQLWKFIRDRRRRPERRTAFDVAGVAMAERSASSWISAAEEHSALRTALAELPDEHRVVLEMFYWDELATAEIAELLAISPVTVRTRLHRARALLETRLRGEQSTRSGY